MMKLFKSMRSIWWVHSLIWAVMAMATVYIFYCGLFGVFNLYLYICLLMLAVEIVTLVLNDWSCPLTIVAKKIDPNWKDGDDIFLPPWFAVHNKNIFGTMLVVGVGLILIRVLYKLLSA